jgi:hypothetical protein
MMTLADAVIAGVAGFTIALLTWHLATAPRYSDDGEWIAFRVKPLDRDETRPGVLSRLWTALAGWVRP